MTSRTLAGAILKSLYSRAQRALPCGSASLSRELGIPEDQILRAVRVLDQAGLVDASRIRLTLAGLAVAVASLGLPSAVPASALRKAVRPPPCTARSPRPCRNPAKAA